MNEIKMITYMMPYPNLVKLFHESILTKHYKNLYNPDSCYDEFRKDIDGCCEIAIRYNLVTDFKRGLLKGNKRINDETILNELRVARLFESYFGKGCLVWDPPGAGNKVGEFILDTQDNMSIFIEVKTRTKQQLTEYGLHDSNINGIIGSMQKAYSKINANSASPFLIVHCHNHFDVSVDDFEMIKALYGLISIENGVPEIISPGFYSDSYTLLSAVGFYYYYYCKPECSESMNFKEYFKIYHNDFANIKIPKSIFTNKADKQFFLSEWSGGFDQQTT